ncbi:MAG: D-sedoheptulose 7-phosphate isomerase [Bacteroidetes bacterium]|nr:D-sedoheptulose 7-phosphate isomerase [Bacteroidota bacterium]
MIERIKNEVKASAEVKMLIYSDDELVNKIKTVCQVIIECYKLEGKTLFAGNGGSAADSQHIAAEFVSRYLFDRPGMASIALTTDTSILTAVGNDYGYDLLFARQLQAIGKKNDVFFAISTSGNSKNIIQALKVCKELGITSVGLTGSNVGEMDGLCDYLIKVPSSYTPRIQESHILIGHIICGVVESYFYED